MPLRTVPYLHGTVRFSALLCLTVPYRTGKIVVAGEGGGVPLLATAWAQPVLSKVPGMGSAFTSPAGMKRCKIVGWLAVMGPLFAPSVQPSAVNKGNRRLHLILQPPQMSPICSSFPPVHAV